MEINKYKNIIGIDEVGRGALAGSLVVCSVVIIKDIPSYLLFMIDDSKKLSYKKRQHIVNEIMPYIMYKIVEVRPKIIDRINILQATLSAMQRACYRLEKNINSINYKIMVDGNKAFNHKKNKVYTIIKGDSKILAIAIASIIAKVHRDSLMHILHDEFKNYGFITNVGYPTLQHKEAIIKYGITSHHRKSFSPCKNYA